MAQNLFRKLKRDWTKLGDMTKSGFENYAKTKVKVGLEQVDEDYDIQFRFQVSEKVSNVTGALEYSIEIPPSSTFIRETDGEEVYVASLFTWLDKGINVSHVRLFEDEETGEEVAIASQKHFNYPNPYPPKDWTKIAAEYHQEQLPKLTLGIIRKFLGGKR